MKVSELLTRLLNSKYSVFRFFTHILAHHFLRDLLFRQTRPLKLREELLVSWAGGPHHPCWSNRPENGFRGNARQDFSS